MWDRKKWSVAGKAAEKISSEGKQCGGSRGGLVLIEVILYSFVILSILDRIAFVNLFCYDFIIFLYLLLYCS